VLICQRDRPDFTRSDRRLSDYRPPAITLDRLLEVLN
jgi:hypothetical protein